MSTQETQPNRHESSGMALSGMILGIVGLLLSFVPAWRSIGLVLAIAGIVLSTLNFAKARKTNAKATRSLTGLICGIVGVCVAGYFLYIRPARVQAEAVPVELRDTTGRGDPSALDKLKDIADSSNTQKQ